MFMVKAEPGIGYLRGDKGAICFPQIIDPIATMEGHDVAHDITVTTTRPPLTGSPNS